MKPKVYLVVSLVLCAMSIIFWGLSVVWAIAPLKDYRNPYISPDGAWMHPPLDLQDQREVKELARSVGYELRNLRDFKKLLGQSNGWSGLASLSGVLAALIATTGIFVANKSVHRTGASPRPLTSDVDHEH